MSQDRDNEIKGKLIDELESLHNSLSSAADNSSNPTSGPVVDEYGIPVLIDAVELFSDAQQAQSKQQKSAEADKDPVSQIYRKALKPGGLRRVDISLIPTLYPEKFEQDSQFDELVDQLVAEYLPIMEQRLRSKLREQFRSSPQAH
ncbi:MAG: hypothetical protein JKX83_09180 [Pseudomonadales bacterium]|nr:hypothetical protein [Pseudomonadales bacterium]